jgi:large subunit ribosomal protein L5
MAALKEIYEKRVIPSMVKKFNYKNLMEVPKVVKVCVNIGVGNAKKDPKLLDAAKKSLALITGQQPVVTRAKKSIAGFNLRKNVPIGCKVTLRGERMYEFLYKLFNLAIPRIKDFRGIPLNGFDHRGNFTLGLQDQLIFPEVGYEEVGKSQGLSVTIVTTAKKDKEAQELLVSLGMPFRH